MAGIGFELKKIFNDKGVVTYVRGYLYSTVVTIGPVFLTMIMIMSIQLLLKLHNKPFYYRQLFIVSIVYAFIFSEIISSGFAMIVTRFIADKIFAEEYEDIVPALYGAICLSLLFGFLPAILFLSSSPLPITVKFAEYILYMELTVMWIMMVFLSTLRDYKMIIISFAVGVVSSLVMAEIVMNQSVISLIFGLILSMDIAILFIIILLVINIKKYFKKTSHKYFLFLTYIEKYPSLFFINFFYHLSLYIHNFFIWGSSYGSHLAGTYVFASLYDIPSFYAFTTIMPTITIFVVFVEVAFYEKFRMYLSYITDRGNLKEILNAKKDMVTSLWMQVTNLMELQMVISLIALVLGNYFLPKIGMTYTSLNIFNLVILGAFLTSIIPVIVNLLLYFEDHKGGLMITITFVTTNALFSYISVKLGSSTFGFGLFLAAFISVAVAFQRINYYFNRLDYFIFCSQPIFNVERKGPLTKFIEYIYAN